MQSGAQDPTPDNAVVAIKVEMGLGGDLGGVSIDLLQRPFDEAELQQLVQHYLRKYLGQREGILRFARREGVARERTKNVLCKPRAPKLYPHLAPMLKMLDKQVSDDDAAKAAAAAAVAAAGGDPGVGAAAGGSSGADGDGSSGGGGSEAGRGSDAGGVARRRLLLALRILEAYEATAHMRPRMPVALRRLAAVVTGAPVDDIVEDDDIMDVMDVVDLTQDDEEVIDIEALVERAMDLVGEANGPAIKPEPAGEDE